MKQVWSKGIEIDKLTEKFTVGDDRILDLRLAKFDIIASIAHAKMLNSISILSDQELEMMLRELKLILQEVEDGNFIIEEGVEDVHSQVELTLTREIGELGKKLHSGRSRNDQVATDIRLYIKWEIEEVVELIKGFFRELMVLAERERDVLLPGYTHLQPAMPSSFGLWFSAYGELLVDDLHLLLASYRVADQSPLGSVAGYGCSFPLDREMTAEELGFSTLLYSSASAQLGRGRAEKAFANGIASIASTLNKFASDGVLFNCSNFGFIKLPDAFTTGSSVMPHKKNPDILELMRGESNLIMALPNQLSLLLTNLPHGYHRDFQLLKGALFPAIDSIKELLEIAIHLVSNIEVNRDLFDDTLYDQLFTVEEVNRRVMDGLPFRDAYREVAEEVERGTFVANKEITHTHIGSVGNLALSKIERKFLSVLDLFTS